MGTGVGWDQDPLRIGRQGCRPWSWADGSFLTLVLGCSYIHALFVSPVLLVDAFFQYN